VDGVRWIAAAADLSAKTQIEVVLQAKDEEAVERIEPVLQKAIALFKKSGTVREAPFLATLLEKHPPKRAGDQIRVVLDSAAVDESLAPAAVKLRENAKVAQTMNNLKQHALAMHNYLDANRGFFPAQASSGKDKKALLSWRVQILPYIEQQALYNEFHHDEPW